MNPIRTILAATTAGASLSVALVALAPTATANPPVGEGGHVHHVTTGTGGCVAIDAVAFLAESRGLHQGAGASGAERGPWHGPC